MDGLTLGLMLMAGLMHASWHSLVKSGSDQTVALAGWAVSLDSLQFARFRSSRRRRCSYGRCW
jgi:hypothetical protein